MKIEKLAVSQVMSNNYTTVKRSTTLIDLIELMRKTHQQVFPVIDEENNIIGIVNYEDILNIFRPFSKSISDIVRRMPFVDDIDDEDFSLELSPEMGTLILVDDILNPNFITIEETKNVQEARRLMRLHNLSVLPVVSGKKLVGVVSILDILIYVFREHDILEK